VKIAHYVQPFRRKIFLYLSQKKVIAKKKNQKTKEIKENSINTHKKKR